MSITENPQIGERISRESLSEEERQDLALAGMIRLNAHAPYTGFHVGAVIRTNNGQTYTGHNFENIIYNGVHAEAAALGQTTPEGLKSGIKTVTYVGGPGNDPDYSEPTICCGQCRQMLLEVVRTEDDPTVIAAGVRGDVMKVKLKALMPLPFYPAAIAKSA